MKHRTLGLCLLVAALGVGSTGCVNTAGPAPGTQQPSGISGASPSTPAMRSGSNGQGMIVTGAEAYPMPGSGNPVVVTASITNNTNRGDMLLGGSCPIAGSAHLYATVGTWPVPTDATGMAALRVMPGWRIDAGGTIQLRSGDGEIVLNGLAQPFGPGDTVQVEFDFADAAPVTVKLPVLNGPSDG